MNPSASFGSRPDELRGHRRDARAQLGDGRVERLGAAGFGGVADRPVHIVATRICSCAWSQTLIRKSPGRATWSSDRGTASGSREMRCRVAASIAPGFTRSAGCIPAEAAGMSLWSAQIAWASCDRAELAVQTKTTRPATGVGTAPSAENASGINCRYVRRPSDSDRTLRTIPRSCSTLVWKATRFDFIPRAAAISLDDMSPTARRSTIRRRPRPERRKSVDSALKVVHYAPRECAAPSVAAKAFRSVTFERSRPVKVQITGCDP